MDCRKGGENHLTRRASGSSANVAAHIEVRIRPLERLPGMGAKLCININPVERRQIIRAENGELVPMVCDEALVAEVNA